MLFLYFNHFLKCDWSISIISQSFYFVKYFFQSFLTFFFLCDRCSFFSAEQLYYYTTTSFLCQVLFSSFFKVFWSRSLPFFSAAFLLYHISSLLSSTFFIFFSKAFSVISPNRSLCFFSSFSIISLSDSFVKRFLKVFYKAFRFPFSLAPSPLLNILSDVQNSLVLALGFGRLFASCLRFTACLLVWQLLYYNTISSLCQYFPVYNLGFGFRVFCVGFAHYWYPLYWPSTPHNVLYIALFIFYALIYSDIYDIITIIVFQFICKGEYYGTES